MSGFSRCKSTSAFDAEWRLPLALVAALLGLRALFLFRAGVDSDEAQHLHVIYEWLKGGWPYRDVFDNHTPLFHWLFLPFARLAGETPDIVLWARLAQIPISFGVLALFYALARRLYDRAVALWALALTLSLADWSLKSLEFRPDVLWTALWFAALCMLVRGPGWRTFFPAGLLLGAALMTSVKTAFLLAALGLGWAGAWMLSAPFRRAYTPRFIARSAGAGALGFVIVPGLFLAGFAAHGALEAMKFCLFTVNQPDAPELWRMALFAIGVPVALGIAWLLQRRGDGVRAAVFLAAAFYALLIIGFSPSLKKQTFLPVYPLLILAAAGAAHSLRWRRMPWAEASLCAVLVVHQLVEGAPWRDGMAEQRALLRDTLALTRPGDSVLDLKGETIFRRRPYFYAFVQATTRGMELGRLPAEEPSKLISSGTAVVAGSGAGFPSATRKFLKDHYFPAGEGLLRVAGSVAKRKWSGSGWKWEADLPVAGDYVVTRDSRTAAGTIHVAAPGRQNLDLGGESDLILFWKPAWERRFRPQIRDDDSARSSCGELGNLADR